jgi:hypothetical protein
MGEAKQYPVEPGAVLYIPLLLLTGADRLSPQRELPAGKTPRQNQWAHPLPSCPVGPRPATGPTRHEAATDSLEASQRLGNYRCAFNGKNGR